MSRQLGEMTDFEKSLETIIETFHKYSAREQHPGTLSKAGMEQLMQQELPNVLKKTSAQSLTDKFFQDFNAVPDRHLYFDDFLKLVTAFLTDEQWREQ